MMNHLLKLHARNHGVLESTIDAMFDHPDGEVARKVYGKQGRKKLGPTLEHLLGNLYWARAV